MTSEPSTIAGSDAQLRTLAEELLAERELIIASNRGPVEFTIGADGTLSAQRGSGGVVTALSAVSRFVELTWIAAAMTDGDRRVAAEAGTERVKAPTTDDRLYLRFVVTPRNVYQRYYNVFCNPLLWFLQHYMWNTPRTPNISRAIYEAWEGGYVPVNRAFAEAVLQEAAGQQAPPYVMVHDYHLYLVPGEVRRQLPEAIIQHFTHIPWPDPRYWELLPRFMRHAIYTNLVAADVIGLQTMRDVRNFLHCCEAFIEGAEVDYRRSTVWYDGHLTHVKHYPISIDAQGLTALAASEEVQRYEEALAPLFEGRTIVRVDRSEPSKNILRGFRAYELLLQRYPEFHGQVTFLAFIVPSRTEINLYQTYTDEIFELVDEINDEYGTADWQPIHLFFENNYEQAIAAMRHYDVLLVNAVIDGMNLVAKEGALVNTRNGVLVLSEAAGAFEQLGEYALPVAPADIEGTVRALHAALIMPEADRRRRAQALRRRVSQEDITTWLETQFRDLLTLA
ncbi:MAG TPA: trehalose-6-phosphate synthase, partial [Dehalococcoidia bacterium]